MDLEPPERALLQAVVRGEHTDLDFRYDGVSFMPELEALEELGLVTIHRGDPATSPYLASCHATALGVRVARRES